MDRDRIGETRPTEGDGAETPDGDPSNAASGPRRSATARRLGRRMSGAMPGAFGTVLLVGAIALGATTVVPMVLTADTSAAPACQDEQGNPIECPSTDPLPGEPTPTPTPTPTATPGGDKPTTEPTDKPDPTKKPEPKPDPTRKPEPTHKPKPKPAPVTLGLELSNVDAGVLVDWTVCKADGFSYYKVVRSTDAIVRWPLGRNDRLVAYIADRTRTSFVDTTAPAGKKLWYRVFCVQKTAHGYRVLNSSPARSIVTPKVEPPAPVELGLDASVGDGGVALHWDACTSDAFHWYKVVRSHGENPSYLPWTEGSQLIGIIENPSVIEFTDTHVESGQTWFYRVQCVGYWHGQKVVLGQTPVREVTIP